MIRILYVYTRTLRGTREEDVANETGTFTSGRVSAAYNSEFGIPSKRTFSRASAGTEYVRIEQFLDKRKFCYFASIR